MSAAALDRYGPAALAPDRLVARTYCRPFPSVPRENSSTNIRVPAMSWLGDHHLVFGVRDLAIPPSLDLHSPRTGRAFELVTWRHKDQYRREPIKIPLAMFPASSAINFVPPYPGVPPKDCDTPNTTYSEYTDGSRGCWDFRHYPQCFNPRRPWLPFAIYENDQHWSASSTHCDALTAVAFFCWHVPSQPSRGGYWNTQRVLSLLKARDDAELKFKRAIEVIQSLGCMQSFLDPASRKMLYDMPWFDHTSDWDVYNWETYEHGRAYVAYTLQYVAELKALTRWIDARSNFERHCGEDSHDYRSIPPNPSFMGVWSTTMVKRDDWLFFLSSGIPIFIVTGIPESHRLFSGLHEGNLDADERYRQDPFEEEHSLLPCWFIPQKPLFEQVDLGWLALDCSSSSIPSELIPVQRPHDPLNPLRKSTAACYRWRHAIFADPDMARFSDSEYVAHQARESTYRDVLSAVPIVFSKFREHRDDTDRHPLLEAIGATARNTGKYKYYNEKRSSDAGYYYPELLSQTSIKRHRQEATYCWTYPRERVEIFSEYPFPGKSIEFGLCNPFQVPEEDDVLMPVAPARNGPRYERHYWEVLESGERRFKFTWTLYVDVNVQQIESPSTHVPPSQNTSSSTKHRLPHNAPNQFCISINPIFALQIAHAEAREPSAALCLSLKDRVFSDYVQELSLADARDGDEYLDHYVTVLLKRQPVAPQHPFQDTIGLERRVEIQTHALRQLNHQRASLRVQLDRRLFKPMRGDKLVSLQAIPWRIEGGGSRDICYPVRIAGLETSTLTKTFFGLMWKMFKILDHDIVLFSVYNEVDATRTFDVGFRYCEDALLVRAQLHGIKIDGMYVEVRFLHALVGKVAVIEYPVGTPLRNVVDRFKRALPLCVYPGGLQDVHNAAFALRRQLERTIVAEKLLDVVEVAEMKDKDCTIDLNPSIEWVSMLDNEYWNANDQTPAISQTHGLGDCEPILHDSATYVYTYAMDHEMRWMHSQQRPSGTRQKDTMNPGSSRVNEMPAKKRRNLLRAIENRASALRTCWRPPGLVLPEVPDLTLQHEDSGTTQHTLSEAVSAFVGVMERLWDWQDQCLGVMKAYRSANEASPHDFSVFEDVFGPLSRLQAVQGAFCTASFAALQRRRQLGSGR